MIGALDGGDQLLMELVLADRAALLAGNGIDRRRAWLDRGVDRLAVDLGRDAVYEGRDLALVVDDLGLNRFVDLTARGIAPEAGRQATVLAGGKRLVDHPLDISADGQALRAQLVLDAVVGDYQVAVERLDELPVRRDSASRSVSPATSMPPTSIPSAIWSDRDSSQA